MVKRNKEPILIITNIKRSLLINLKLMQKYNTNGYFTTINTIVHSTLLTSLFCLFLTLNNTFNNCHACLVVFLKIKSFYYPVLLTLVFTFVNNWPSRFLWELEFRLWFKTITFDLKHTDIWLSKCKPENGDRIHLRLFFMKYKTQRQFF